MSASSSLSVEIWQTILRYAIAVTDFLDTDPSEGVLVETLYKNLSTPHHDESAYWRAEKTRNRLQLVSKSWDEYLRRFEHRYVHMGDIRHGRVKPDKLRNAKRISFNRCSRICSKCFDYDVQFDEFCQYTLSQIDNLDAQIFEIGPGMHSLLQVESHTSKFAHVSTLYAQNCDQSLPLVRIIGALPNLRRAYVKGPRGWELRHRSNLMAQNLHTLSLRIPAIAEEYDGFTLELPSLRHLSIGFRVYLPTPGFIKGEILRILRDVGGKLRSLHLKDRAERSSTLGEVWELCPKLETFYTRYPLIPSPPYFHPIHTLIVGEKFQLKELKAPPDWPNLRRVVLDHGEGFAAYKNWGALSIACRVGVRVEDKHGLTMEEFTAHNMAMHIPG